MPRLFKIDDEFHADLLDGNHPSFEAALAEVRRLAVLPWDSEPNQTPCENWRNCGRFWEIVEFEAPDMADMGTWHEIQRTPAMEISQAGVIWHGDFDPANVGEPKS